MAADDYDVKRLKQVALRLRIARSLQERLSWSADKLHAYRLEELKAFLAYVREHSPWHRERLKALDIDALTFDRFAELPSMTKSDLMENWDAIVTRPGMTLSAAEDHVAMKEADGKPRYFDGDCHVVTSSGTSGLRGVFAYDWDGWATYSASTMQNTRLAMITRRLAEELGRGPRMALVAVDKPTHATGAAHACFSSPNGASIIPFDQPIDDIVRTLNERQPESLVCYGAIIETLIREARAGRLSIPLRMLVANAERVDPAVASEAHEVWDLVLPVLNPWASVETIGTFACPLGKSHLSEDTNIFELVDEHDMPVASGDTSEKIFVTVLYNRLLPLIRYEIPDRFREIEETCACGCPAHRRVDVLGRTEGFYYDDVKVHPALFMARLLEDRRIKRTQVRQTVDGAEIDVVAAEMPDEELLAIGNALSRDLARVGVIDPVVSVTSVDAIRPGKSGKTPSFVPLPKTLS